MTNPRQGIPSTSAGITAPSHIRNQACRNEQQPHNNQQAVLSGMNTVIIGTGSSPGQSNSNMVSFSGRYTVNLLGLLQGSKCYTDASTMPDLHSLIPKKAGIGVLITNTQVHPPQNIYIKAAMSDSTSVLMAAAAALALAIAVTDRLHLQHTNFLSDNQELVHLLNCSDHSNPPDWRIKHLTQLFINYTHQRSTRAYKIKRRQNQTADTLARQALIWI